jgi:hypothetical protein
MGVELRETMVYQSPPELGALYSEVEAMMKHMGQTQRVLIAKQMREEELAKVRRKKRLEKLRIEIAIGISAIVFSAFIGLTMAYVVQDRIQKYPHLGDGWIPKSEEQRRRDAAPKVWIGR